MDYDWLWVILAVGVLAPVGVVPFALARDACCWWREQRRDTRTRDGGASAIGGLTSQRIRLWPVTA